MTPTERTPLLNPPPPSQSEHPPNSPSPTHYDPLSPSQSSSISVSSRPSFSSSSGALRSSSSSSSSSSSPSSPHLPDPLRPATEYTPTHKKIIILTTTLASTFSPLSSNIYYPALNGIARELGVSSGEVNLSITGYMICQALAPQITSALSDTIGRKPLYTVCLSFYILANILLANTHSFTALLIFRSLQSTAISGTVALSAAVAADLVERHERGAYMAYTGIGNVLAPSLGPVLGGVLVKYFGWRGVFWGLALGASVVLMAVVLGVPETRGYRERLKGDSQQQSSGYGAVEQVSVKSQSASSSLLTSLKAKPLSSLSILLHPPTTFLLLSNGLVFAAYYAVTAGMPSLFNEIYGLSDMWIGFVLLPAGVGSLVSAVVGGRIVDWNYRRWLEHHKRERRSGVEDGNNEGLEGESKESSVERARLQIGVPMTLISALSILTYGLMLSRHPPLAVSLLLIFLVSFSVTASYNVMNVLLVDLYYSTPATVMATNNLVRCFLGAASTALVTPVIGSIGIRRTYGVVATVVVGICCPLLGIVYCKGVVWGRGRGDGQA